MPENDLGEKTEPATPRKRRELRKQGNLARSMDLSAALSLGGALILLYLFAPELLRRLAVLIRSSLAGVGVDPSSQVSGPKELLIVLRTFAQIAGPIVALIFVVTLISAAVQVGWLITGEPLQPKLDRLDPINGAKRFFSMQTIGRAGLNIGKVIVLMVISVIFVSGRFNQILALPRYEFADAFVRSGRMVMQLFLWLVIALIILGILDYVFQKWQWERQNKMTKHEVKEELRTTMGSPELRQRQRSFARKIMNQRLSQAVPRADVVVTNPEHLAIALKWDPDKMNAPIVLAKGADYVALRIRQIAAANHIPIIEKKELARAMYPIVQVGHEIPPMFFQAVAEVLAFVYRLNGQLSAA